jgi:hypothetical protein
MSSRDSTTSRWLTAKDFPSVKDFPHGRENPLQPERLMLHACLRVPVRRPRRLRAPPRGDDGCLGTAVFVGTAVVGGPACPRRRATLTLPRSLP